MEEKVVFIYVLCSRSPISSSLTSLLLETEAKKAAGFCAHLFSGRFEKRRGNEGSLGAYILMGLL
jgi:hypothetical protein